MKSSASPIRDILTKEHPRQSIASRSSGSIKSRRPHRIKLMYVSFDSGETGTRGVGGGTRREEGEL